MANVLFSGPFIWSSEDIPPGGSAGFFITPFSNAAAIVITAHGLPGLVNGPQSLTVSKQTTRTEGTGDSRLCTVDFTVRNDGPNRCPYVRVVTAEITA